MGWLVFDIVLGVYVSCHPHPHPHLSPFTLTLTLTLPLPLTLTLALTLTPTLALTLALALARVVYPGRLPRRGLWCLCGAAVSPRRRRAAHVPARAV